MDVWVTWIQFQRYFRHGSPEDPASHMSPDLPFVPINMSKIIAVKILKNIANITGTWMVKFFLMSTGNRFNNVLSVFVDQQYRDLDLNNMVIFSPACWLMESKAP